MAHSLPLPAKNKCKTKIIFHEFKNLTETNLRKQNLFHHTIQVQRVLRLDELIALIIFIIKINKTHHLCITHVSFIRVPSDSAPCKKKKKCKRHDKEQLEPGTISKLPSPPQREYNSLDT